MEEPGSFIDFFQALISGTGVLLGFSLASQITILTHVLDLTKVTDKSSEPKKQWILIFFTWFFTIITIILCFCLISFQASTAETPVIMVRDTIKNYVEIAYYLYALVLPILIIISQVICSLNITKILGARTRE